MERETSGSDFWLWCARQATIDQTLTVALKAVANAVDCSFGAHLWFAEILGKRWSYVVGFMDDRPSVNSIERIELSARIGLVVDTWGCLSAEDRVRLVDFLKGLVTSKGRPSEDSP